MQLLLANKQVYWRFIVVAEVVAGVSLLGSEVKALFLKQASLKEAFVLIQTPLVVLKNCHISHYSFANQFNHEPLRDRRLLLNQHEICRLQQRVKKERLVLVPIKFMVQNHKIKLVIGLAKAKKLHDKRAEEKIKELHQMVRPYLG